MPVREAALKIEEATSKFAAAFSAADLRHGPVAIAAGGTQLLAFAHPEPASTDVANIASGTTSSLPRCAAPGGAIHMRLPVDPRLVRRVGSHTGFHAAGDPGWSASAMEVWHAIRRRHLRMLVVYGAAALAALDSGAWALTTRSCRVPACG